MARLLNMAGCICLLASVFTALADRLSFLAKSVTCLACVCERLRDRFLAWAMRSVMLTIFLFHYRAVASRVVRGRM